MFLSMSKVKFSYNHGLNFTWAVVQLKKGTDISYSECQIQKTSINGWEVLFIISRT